MSVIPIIFRGDDPTAVDSVEGFQQAGGLNGHAVLIKNLDESQFAESARGSNITYDLRVGNEYRDHREIGKRDLLNGQPLRILPGMAVIIETMEELQLPRRVFGAIVPKVALAQEGLTTTASKVDPGYAGRLLITTFNLGKSTVELRPGDVLCSIYFMEAGERTRAYSKPGKKLQGAPTGGRWSRFQYWLEAHSGLWMVVVSVLTAMLLVAQLVSFFAHPRPVAKTASSSLTAQRDDR